MKFRNVPQEQSDTGKITARYCKHASEGLRVVSAKDMQNTTSAQSNAVGMIKIHALIVEAQAARTRKGATPIEGTSKKYPKQAKIVRGFANQQLTTETSTAYADTILHGTGNGILTFKACPMHVRTVTTPKKGIRTSNISETDLIPDGIMNELRAPS
ncbi:hypothetical protein BJ508DRAFT_309138 [Ascobolus immersus RN42]|uniref:Uncharacterized protein n=1 Tax=Ascobolus immersus RN42 TaxID=1160509 RepID=A0A3N4HXS9_ASCIM|nr:hypothetical protein BJ508DRAFT_309138 [Ascobolus immersus RN42]